MGRFLSYGEKRELLEMHTSNLIYFDEVINQAINNKSVNTYKINGYENLCNYTFKNIPERTYSGRRTDQFCPMAG